MKFASGLKDDGVDGHSSATASILSVPVTDTHGYVRILVVFSMNSYKDLFIVQGPKLA